MAPFARERVSGAGSFAVDRRAPPGFVAMLLARHEEAERAGVILKRKYGTVVTRVPIAREEARALDLALPAAAVKQSALGVARRLVLRLGARSRYRRDVANGEALRALGFGAPRVIAHSLRPAGASEWLVTALIPGRTVRELIWLGERTLRDPGERRELLGALGGWLRALHEAGVWHRDLKAENVIRREPPGEPDAFHLLDLTRLRLEARPLARARRLRNLAQLLDLPARFDEEALPALLLGYAPDPSEAARWAGPVQAAIAERRARRAARTGHRHVDQEYVGTKGARDV